jgi:hypothetical protein
VRSAWRSWALGVLVAAAFLWGVIGLFNRQFASGELYPEYSTMRTDRYGTKLLFDSLRKLPGIEVERNFLPMEFLPRDGAALVLLGVNPLKVNWDDALFLQAAEKLARRGNRVIVAMHVDNEYDYDRPTQENFERRDEPVAKGPKKKSGTNASFGPPLKEMWGVTFRIDPEKKHPHPLYFGRAEGWKVRDAAGAKTLAIERDFGKGSVVLMAESADFTNASAVGVGRLRQVSGALGPYGRIVFDEQHLGLAESGSVVGMARQFRLMGFAFGLAICAALFIWRNAAAFPPPRAARSIDRFSGRTSQAGLLTLLQRHIAPTELAAVCWREWLSTNGRQASPERRKLAEAILAGAAGRPVEATREIQALLHTKGEL